MPNRDLNNMRESYESSLLLEEHCDINPFKQFDKWFQQAIEAKLMEPNAMQIATVGQNLQPTLRTVLLKSFDENGFIFYTNYESKKGNQIAENDKVALLFWFREHERQVRIEGVAHKTDHASNEIYFHSRPRDSQIAAAISNQSKVIENRDVLEKLFNEKDKDFANREIPLRENWGGYIVTPNLFEFWQGRKNRLHDRIQYSSKQNHAWQIDRLSP